jgi:thioredoxin 1
MKHLNDDTLPDALRSDRPVLIDFVATWCPPCRAMKPALDAVAGARADVDFVTVDVDESPLAAQTFGVRAMPTLVLFRGGRAIAQVVGAQSRDGLARFLDEGLARP